MKPSKECILYVDEIKKSFLYYDLKRDEIVGFHNTHTIKTDELMS